MKKVKKLRSALLVISVCIVMTLSIVLVGCGGNEVLDQYQYQEDNGMIQLSSWKMTSGVPSNVITVDFADSDVVVVCSSDQHGFWQDNAYSQEVEIAVGEDISWNMGNSGKTGDKSLLEVRLYSGDKVVGFAVIEAIKGQDSIYDATVVKSVVFTQVDNEYQNITDSQVDEIIASL